MQIRLKGAAWVHSEVGGREHRLGLCLGVWIILFAKHSTK